MYFPVKLTSLYSLVSFSFSSVFSLSVFFNIFFAFSLS
jgi:hypothetical protein